MYISCLWIDVGTNPDRPRPGRLWLRNRYHVHQRLCMAFPSEARKREDVGFLKPFVAEEFGNGQVHVPRGAESGFLFRVDPHSYGRTMIVVQSAIVPDWEYAFHNAGYLLAAPPQVGLFEPRFSRDESLRFRLSANPTRRLSRRSPDAQEQSIKKRVAVPTDQLEGWLARRAESAGFRINPTEMIVQPGYAYMYKAERGQRLRSVLFSGVLCVTDSDAFEQALVCGIGSQKAFGFGLLSVARMR